MSAGRKPRQAPQQVAVELNHEALGKAQAARDELVVLEQATQQNAAELALRLGYEGPLQPELLEHGIRQQMRRTADACLEMGRMLLLLKESVGHGEFVPRVEALGLPVRAAQKFMQLAFKLANAPKSALLLQAIGTQNKALELLVLDDEEIHELADGKSVRGLTLDKVACMGVMDLRAALRDAQENLEAKDKLIEQKNKKIDQLASAKKFKPAPDAIAQTEQHQAMLTELAEVTARAEVVLMQLATVVGAIEGATPSKAMRGRAAQAVQYMCQRLAELIDEHDIPVAISAELAVRPDWLDPLPAEGKSTH